MTDRAPLTLADCRPEVLAFALLMEQELRANDHKPGWKDDRPLDLAWRVKEEAQELYNAVWDATHFATPLDDEQLDAPTPDGLKSLRQRIASEAADAANMAMMVADVCGALPGFASYPARVAAACAVLFEGDPTDVAERRDRFAEEANEVCQALGMTREAAHQLVDYTHDRPVGDPAQEIGAALTTLTSLANQAGHDLMACAEADLAKLERPDTVERIRTKRATRHGRGPLPGLSATASEDAP